MAAKPGAVPSTNSMPRSRIILSSAAPIQIPLTGSGPVIYLHASIISQAKSAATPASRAFPKYGSQTLSVGREGNNSLANLNVFLNSAKVSDFSPVKEYIMGRE